MAGLKEIKRRIKSVKNTEKITYAMKLVSASKLRKAQDALLKAREYSSAMESLLGNLIIERSREAAAHPIMVSRKNVKRVRLVVLGGKRGLSGAYNSNVNRLLESVMAQYKGESEIEILAVGKQPAEYCKRKGYEYIPTYENVAEDVEDWPIDEIYASCEQAFISHQVDEVVVLYTRFQSAMSVHPTAEKILPFAVDFHGDEEKSHGTTLYKPSIEAVFQVFIPKYVQAKMMLACLEAKASEHGSRMTAMDAATHNAGELIDSLTITHNKLRQASITNDMLDIIGGSASAEK